jgi:uncharacterized secreted repeat protein (TIGR03808 family)
MTIDRRALLSAGAISAGAGLSVLAAAQTAAAAGTRDKKAGTGPAAPVKPALQPGSLEDQTEALQTAINDSAAAGQALHLPAGTFRSGALSLPANAKVIGASGLTVLQFTGGAAFVSAKDAAGIVLQDIVFDGGALPLDPEQSDGLLRFEGCAHLTLHRVEVRKALLNGISLTRCSGRISDCTITTASQHRCQRFRNHSQQYCRLRQ